MPKVYKIIWHCPCLLYKADTLSQSHCILQVWIKAIKMHPVSSCFIFLSLSRWYFQRSKPFTRLEKGVSVVFEVGWGGECQQTSAPHYLGCKSLYNSWGNMQEVLAQLEGKRTEVWGEAHLHAVKVVSKHLSLPFFSSLSHWVTFFT